MNNNFFTISDLPSTKEKTVELINALIDENYRLENIVHTFEQLKTDKTFLKNPKTKGIVESVKQ